MQRDREIRFRNHRVQPAGEHCLGAVNRFFRRLPDQNQSAAPLIFQLGEHLRRAQHVRDVNVVAARMHHAHLLARVILGRNSAGVC